MVDLASIDLTEGQVIERSSRKIITIDNDRGVHRLKKGEIPHSKYGVDSDSIITIPSMTITTTQTVADWVEYIDDIRVIDNTRFNIVNLDEDSFYTSFTSPLDTSISITTNTSFSRFTDLIVNNSSTLYLHNSFYNKTEKSIDKRIATDPFEDSEGYNSISFSDVIDRMKKLSKSQIIGYEQTIDDSRDRLKIVDHNNERYQYQSTILERLGDDGYNDMRDKFNQLESTLLNINLNSFINTETNLKKKAPFIKRVYTTNLGRSFDSEELKLDMIKAQEHFDECVKLLRIY